MVSPADERDLFPGFLYVYVDDADATYQLALDPDALSLEEQLEMFYGDRRAMVQDPFGNIFQIADHRPSWWWTPANVLEVGPNQMSTTDRSGARSDEHTQIAHQVT
jgi:hypothetical protein